MGFASSSDAGSSTSYGTTTPLAGNTSGSGDALRRRPEYFASPDGSFEEFAYPPYSELPFTTLKRRKQQQQGKDMVKWTMRAVLASPVIVLVIWSVCAVLFATKQQSLHQMQPNKQMSQKKSKHSSSSSSSGTTNNGSSNNNHKWNKFPQFPSMGSQQQGGYMMNGYQQQQQQQQGGYMQPQAMMPPQGMPLQGQGYMQPQAMMPPPQGQGYMQPQMMSPQGQGYMQPPQMMPPPPQGQGYMQPQMMSPQGQGYMQPQAMTPQGQGYMQTQGMNPQGQGYMMEQPQAQMSPERQMVPPQQQQMQQDPSMGVAPSVNMIDPQVLMSTGHSMQEDRMLPIVAPLASTDSTARQLGVQPPDMQQEAPPLMGSTAKNKDSSSTNMPPLPPLAANGGRSNNVHHHHRVMPRATQSDEPALGEASDVSEVQATERQQVYYYDPKQAMDDNGELQIPQVVYDQQGNAVDLNSLQQSQAKIFLEPPGRQLSTPSIPTNLPKWGESASQDQSIIVSTVAVMALLVGALSARRLRSRSFLSSCIENESLEDDVAYDTAYTTTDNSYNTFGGWKGDLEKFDV